MGIMNKASRFVGPLVLPKISYQKRIIDTYTHFYLSEAVERQTVLYESRDGKSLTDSPFAIFQHLLKTDKKKEYTHYWVVTPGVELKKIQDTYQEHDNVHFILRNSDDYLKWLAKAEYLINNSTFQGFVTIKEEQTYINTWHGTPLKTMGFDIPGNPANAKNVVRNFFMADYLISPNPHTTKMFVDSYRLKNNYPGKIIEAGYPRIDQTFQTTKQEMYQQLNSLGVEIEEDKPIMLYSPTIKEGSLTPGTEQVAKIHAEMSRVREKFDEEFQVLIKVHPFLYQEAKDYPEIVPYLIPDVVDTNQLLAVTDCLITDYSSIFFDFLVTDKPIFFYCWDDDLYDNERGKYLTYDELPGPVAFSVEELIQQLEKLPEMEEKYRESYRKFKQDYVPYDDGKVTEKIVEIIFEQKELPKVKILTATQDKKRLLIYPGGLHSNGITSSFLNLLHDIDQSQYEVICFLDDLKSADQITNAGEIPEFVSLLFRFNPPNFTTKENYQDLMLHMNGVKQPDKYPNELYEREVRRLLGHPEVDVAIDFIGYSLHWSKMVLGVKASRYVCYLHSDMKLDQQREVNGRKIHQMNLKGIFSVYHRYDKSVSVSEVINKINQEKLSQYASPEKFVYAENTINPDKILGKIPEPVVKHSVATTTMNQDGQIKVLNQGLPIATARPDTGLGMTQEKIFTEKEIRVLGSFTHEGLTYYKIMAQQLYVGWLEEKYVKLLPVSITTDIMTSYFGKINTVFGDSLYSGPIGLEETELLGSAEWLRNLYVTVEREVQTQVATSIEIKLNDQVVGFLPKNKITYSNQGNWTKGNHPPMKVKLVRQVLKSNNRLHKKVIEKNLVPLPKEIKKIASYLAVSTINKRINLYQQPKESQTSVQWDNQVYVYVNLSCVIEEKTWYQVTLTSGETGFILGEETTLEAIKKEVIVSQGPNPRVCGFLKEEVDVYASEKDILADHRIKVRALQEVEAKEKLITSKQREFFLVDWEGRDLWVQATDLEEVASVVQGVWNAEGMLIPFPDKSKTNIVTTGRLSQEKNQITLIKGFKDFQEEIPNSHLYIIGAGPEENNLKMSIKEFGLEEKVTLLGQVYKPFDFMKECDVFALTSLYEGQSIVLLEALTLGMICLSTDIPACRKVLGDGKYGFLTKSNDAKGVAEGLKQVIEENEKFSTFNAYVYNEKALEQFYNIINEKKPSLS